MAVLAAGPLAAAEWPNVPDFMLENGPAWPNVPDDDAPDLTATRSAPKASPRWLSPTWNAFALEGGLRYWYSRGNTSFAFANGTPGYGDPTSTIDWNGTDGHSGEVFARVDHRPTGLFVKGILGGGALAGGEMVDRDFFAGQFKFSDTSSAIKGSNFSYGMVDVGYAYNVPGSDVRFGGFVGYHYWREKMTAYGGVCNRDDVAGFFCGPPGSAFANFDTPVMVYEPTWHAIRLGLDTKIRINDAFSITGEAAWVPWARLYNKDSHLLRQSFGDLGPAPNVLTSSNQGFGAEAEVLLNYALTANIDISAGFRYWLLTTSDGTTQFGPEFSQDFALRKFDSQRYGVLLQIKGRL